MDKVSVPKYEQAYQVIVKWLKDGRYPIGGRLPTESEFSEHFKVSRVTIRRTLDLLVLDGYIERKQGSGYRVLTLSPASDTCLTSFTDAMLRSGQEPISRLISIEQIAAGFARNEQLPKSLTNQSLTCIRRLRLVDDEPRMWVETYAPSQLLIDVVARDFPESGARQSMLRILSGRFEMIWCEACEDISPIAAAGNIAEALHVSVGHPLLKQSCTAFDNNGDVVFHEDVFRSGSIRFNLTTQSRTPLHF